MVDCIYGFSELRAIANCMYVFPEICAMADCIYGLSEARLMEASRRNGGLYLWIFRIMPCGRAAADRFAIHSSRWLAAATEFSTDFNCSQGRA